MRRYTNVLALLDLLRHKHITLLDPSRWYDQNDALGLRAYSKLMGNGSVYAICLAEGYEQAHHWQIFAGDSHGVAIVFNKQSFISDIDQYAANEILHGPVIYQNLSQVRKMDPIPKNALPFLKRDTFKAEQEYRVVAWEDEIFAMDNFKIPISIRSIDRIVLGPGMPDALAESLKSIASSLEGCSELQFTKSRLVNNRSWADAISKGLTSYEAG